ncbi:hypothetical protein Aeqsu_1753 [Aequorivita sublithincola DSM 14238]|uniref:DUF4375 domain-containing protein n=1 Tax=Aequorivita sublithincola (strain DSM 14238 / LMG 21431 / ACAM 643 / 9-3) TaxID=746697 RepID=I3YW65_AEQSU|nr:DUF6624 domain-containing protein [Aequorivita sublithincola]AFL81233.1 hypothetical protein Aeqsu_1753 [Aequorivita sublithincola DSM 14238]
MKYISLLLCFFITTSLFSQTSSQYETPTKQQLDSLTTKLETLFMKDQTFRRIYIEAENKLGADSDAYEYFWEVVEAQDKVLEKELIDILDKYGWLGISQVGRLANGTQWSVLQHGTVASKEKYAPLLKASVLNNESQAIHYARLIDRMLLNSDRLQLYGTQINYATHTPTFYELKDPEFVDKRRNELGLDSIEEFARSNKIEWSIKQKQ